MRRRLIKKERGMEIIMKKIIATFLLFLTPLLFICAPGQKSAEASSTVQAFKLGNEVLFSSYTHLINNKKVGLITNQSGVNSKGVSTASLLYHNSNTTLAALYAPEHGLDGLAKAGEYVESYTHPQMNIPVYSLYGATRMPTEAMLKDVDLLLYDIQDIGARTYTYISTLNYCMVAAERDNKPIIVLDRPNPLGGLIVEGPVLEDFYKTFVGIDNLPKAHGMTVGELALFFNRKIGADLTVIPMEGYTRNMIYADTGLSWVPTSPNIPDINSVFGYMATGLGEGTGVFQGDQFKWIGGRGLDAEKFAATMNGYGLPGITFIPEQRGSSGGARLQIDDYRTFNPAKTGIYGLSTAFLQGNFQVPKSGNTANSVVMFDKIMGTNKIGQYLEAKLTPQQIEANYAPALQQFKIEREKYLLPNYGSSAGAIQGPVHDPGQNAGQNPGSEPGQPSGGQMPIYDHRQSAGKIKVLINGEEIAFDVPPFIDANQRVMVPLRGIAESLGATVHWNPDTGIITIDGSETRIIFQVNSKTVTVDGAQEEMDTTPVITGGRTMIPARYTGQYLGADVQWDGASQTVYVSRR